MLIENWSNNVWIKDWIPIIIAIIALITSILSLYWTRREYIRNSRPYVWASNYGVVDSERKTIIQVPFRVGFRVKNSPARIRSTTIELFDITDKIFARKLESLVRYPDESSEWSFAIGQSDFASIMNRTDEKKADLTRKIKIKYSSLDGGRTYTYELHQKFVPIENQWSDTYECAD